jgi:hypothetical protein
LDTVVIAVGSDANLVADVLPWATHRTVSLKCYVLEALHDKSTFRLLAGYFLVE